MFEPRGSGIVVHGQDRCRRQAKDASVECTQIEQISIDGSATPPQDGQGFYDVRDDPNFPKTPVQDLDDGKKDDEKSIAEAENVEGDNGERNEDKGQGKSNGTDNATGAAKGKSDAAREGCGNGDDPMAECHRPQTPSSMAWRAFSRMPVRRSVRFSSSRQAVCVGGGGEGSVFSP